MWQAIVCLLLCFSQIYLSCTQNCSEHQNKTIFCTKQVNSGKNTEVNKQLLVIFWLNWRKYGSVSYSLSCNTEEYGRKLKNIFIDLILKTIVGLVLTWRLKYIKIFFWFLKARKKVGKYSWHNNLFPTEPFLRTQCTPLRVFLLFYLEARGRCATAASRLPNGCVQPNQPYGRHLVHSGFRIIPIYYLSILP